MKWNEICRTLSLEVFRTNGKNSKLRSTYGVLHLHFGEETESSRQICCLISSLKWCNWTPHTRSEFLLSKSYSLWKLQITSVPAGQPQFLFLFHSISCLSDSVFLVCLRILSLGPFLTLAFVASFLCSCSLYLPLCVSLLSVSLRAHLPPLSSPSLL